MKRLVAVLAALAVAAVGATPADALTGFRRTFATDCVSGKIEVFNNATGNTWRSPQPCREPVWVPEKQTYTYIDRPWTDFKAGNLAANRWYPNCYHELDDASEDGGGDYILIYAFLCD